MPQQARDAEFAPHAAIDLRDQNSMFLALEELGIACMQDAWIRSNDPGHKDAAAVHEQAEAVSYTHLTLPTNLFV